MQILYFDCQSDVDLDSLTASLFSAGLSFDDWRLELQKTGDCIGLDFNVTLIDTFNQSVQVKKLCFEHCCSGNNLTCDDSVPVQEVLNDLEKCNCDNAVKNLSRTVFARLLESEAQVRGLSLSQLMLSKQILEKTLLQIIGFALAYKSMQIDHVFSAPFALSSNGSWSAKASTGDFSLQSIDLLVCDAGAAITGESSALTSPVVAAVLTTVVSKWSMPSFSALRKVGFGCGGNTLSDNGVCRALFGELKAARFRSELISVLETNLDDLSPQVLSFAVEELFAAGALDVFVSPVIMKKGRGGHLLTILCNLSDKENIQSTVFAHTSTLGIRSYDCERSVAERESTSVLLDDGHSIRIKIGFDLQGKIINAQPEYEDCAAYARSSGQSVQEVIRLALTKFDHKASKSSLSSILAVAVLFACFMVLPMYAKSSSTAVSSTSSKTLTKSASSAAVQFGDTLRQARSSSLNNEGGFEIYSWNVGGKWHYSLLPASKRERTLEEVTEYSVTRRSFIELETALGKLAPCVVTWHNQVLKEDGAPDSLSMPHQIVLHQLKKYCQNRRIKLVL